MMIPVSVLHDRWMQDPEYREAYDALATEFAIAEALIAARARAGLSQAELAERMGTSTAVIARMESGRAMPSGRALLRYAQATGSRIQIQLVPA